MKDKFPIPQEDYDYVGNWLILDIYHDRYSFENSCRLVFNKTLQEVIDETYAPETNDWTKPRGELFPDEHHYLLDRCYSTVSTYCHDLKNYQISAIEIINIDELYEEKYVDFLWGFTNKKYGLLDTKDGEAY